MIKVNSLFPRDKKHQQIGIQTDFLLPKVVRKAENEKNWHHLRKSQYQSHLSSQVDQNSHLLNRSYNSSVIMPNSSGILKKKNDEGRRIQTKYFKFLSPEENHTKQAIMRFLLGCPEPRKDARILMKKINLSYVSRQLIKPSEKNIDQSSESMTIDIPQITTLSVTIRQVIQTIRNIYQENNQEEATQKILFKKIKLAALRVIKETDCLQINMAEGESHRSALEKYLATYIENMECKGGIKNYGNKRYLNRFYDEIYRRYQKHPFIERKTDIAEEEDIDDNQQLIQNQQSKENLMLKKKAKMNQSAIKMKFYDNFRKEVEVLSADTEQILNNETRKYSQL